jgi:hypothetical protein
MKLKDLMSSSKGIILLQKCRISINGATVTAVKDFLVMTTNVDWRVET